MGQKTNKMLEDLHGQLSAIQLDDDAKQQDLTSVTQAIRSSLDEPNSPHRLTLRDRLEKAAVVFEVDHPHIAHALRAAIDSLSEAGF